MFFLLCPGKTTFHASQGLASGWVQVLRGPRPPSEKWPSAKDAHRVHQSGRWRQPKPDKVHPLQSPPPLRQPSNPPEAAAAIASAEVQRLETAISALGETSPHAKPLVEALRIARAKSAVPPLQQRIQSRKLYIERAKQRVVRAEAVITRAVEQKAIYDGEVAEGEERLQQLLSEDALPAPPAPACPAQVAELQRQIDDLMKEREMWKVAQKQGIWCSDGPPSVKEIPPIPACAQELGGWISERNCDLRNALEFGDTSTIAQIGSLLSKGISQLASVSRDVPESRSSMMESLIEESDAKRRLIQVGAETLRVMPSMLVNHA